MRATFPAVDGPSLTVARDVVDALGMAPVPGWAHLVAVARAAAGATEPPGAFRCEVRDGRLAWRDVRGPAPLLDVLCLLEELSGQLCEVCGGPGGTRERWGGWVRTLCPGHAVAIAAAGPRFGDVYALGWRAVARRGPGAANFQATAPRTATADVR